jgi:hypothetical protein
VCCGDMRREGLGAEDVCAATLLCAFGVRMGNAFFSLPLLYIWGRVVFVYNRNWMREC